MDFFKSFSLLGKFFDDVESIRIGIEITFAIDKLINFLHLIGGKNLTAQEIGVLSSKFVYENALFRKGGNQTLFNTRIFLDTTNLRSVCIKFFNEKIRPQAIIQYIASYLYVEENNIIFEHELQDKIILIKPAKILFFSIYDFSFGRSAREVPVLVQENIESNIPIKDYLTRKELSDFSKKIARRGFTFDSFESNFKVLKVEQNLETKKETIYCSYIDIFQNSNYDLIKQFIDQILKHME